MAAPFPYTLDPSANKQPYIYGAICTVYALAVAGLALRIKARRISGACLGADDFLLVTSLVFATAQFIDMLLLLHNGLGQHLKSLPQLDRMLKMFLFSDVTYYCTLAFAKYSILLFYWRIFGHVKAIHWPIYILLGLTTGWFIEVVVITIFGCTPVASFWNFSINGEHCVDFFKFSLPNLVINFVTDILILALPLPFIWRLQQSVTQKVLISLMFLCGGFVCVVSLIRLFILLRTDFSSIDESWYVSDFAMWCTVEANFAIISACLPLLRPIFKASTSYVSNVYKKSTRSLSRSNKSSSGFSNKTYGVSASKDSGSMEEDMLPMHETQIYGGKPVRGHEGPITIETEVSFGYETRRQMETRRNALENGRS